MNTPSPLALRRQQQRRMAHRPHLYFEAPEHVRAWAVPWQRRLHARLTALEHVFIDPDAFVAPTARLFAEPHRPIRLAAGASVAADAHLQGPVELGEGVSLNVRVSVDGGRRGVRIGAGTRIAAGALLFAFEHGLDPHRPIAGQPVSSLGIVIGEDVWIGAAAGITDGVTVGAHAVVGMGAVVTADVEPWQVVAGVPARPIGDRRTWSGP